MPTKTQIPANSIYWYPWLLLNIVSVIIPLCNVADASKMVEGGGMKAGDGTMACLAAGKQPLLHIPPPAGGMHSGMPYI